MRQKALAAAFFVALSGMLAFPVFSQDRAASYETYIMDSFDNNGEEEWSWIAAGSKLVTQGYPRIKYFDGMPNALRLSQSDPEGQYRVMGVEVRFDRQGDNWVDIIPMMAGEDGEDAPYEIPFRGVASRVDMWVWGSGYLYELELLVRDIYGRVHTLPMGWLNFEGWRNLSVTIPASVPQATRYLTDNFSLSFVALRIRTAPRERVDEFKIFFDQIRVLSDNTYKASYDGFEFAGADFADASAPPAASPAAAPPAAYDYDYEDSYGSDDYYYDDDYTDYYEEDAGL